MLPKAVQSNKYFHFTSNLSWEGTATGTESELCKKEKEKKKRKTAYNFRYILILK